MRAAVLILALAVAAVARPSAAPTVRPPALRADTVSSCPGLHNVVAYARDFYSGSAPDGAVGFESLRALGVRTIISVDGAAPDIAAARAVGLRYIHLPIGYNGMDHERTLEIAKAVKVSLAKGPVYIHCHHGKHRSAGAAGAAAVTLGWLSTDEATRKLHISGTAPDYTGLYQCVSVAQVASAAELDKVPDTFPELSRPSGYVRSMVEIDQVMDHLKAIENAGWAVPTDHPDLVPVAEAGRMADLLRIVGEDPKARARPEELRGWLRAASNTATEIEDRLVTAGKGAPPDAAGLSARLKALGHSCTRCHAKYRD